MKNRCHDETWKKIIKIDNDDDDDDQANTINDSFWFLM